MLEQGKSTKQYRFFYGDMTSSNFDAMSDNLCAVIEMMSSPNLANLFLFTERTSWKNFMMIEEVEQVRHLNRSNVITEQHKIGYTTNFAGW